ncbi:Hypothetical protein NocV09_05600240 [Nannochloropsis oceanica]
MSPNLPPPLSRRLPAPLARVRRYIEESWESVRPMDNPPGYDEAHGISTKEKAGNKRWRNPVEHARVWQRAFQAWRNSFDYDTFRREGGLGRGLVRGKAGDDADAVLRNGWTPEATSATLMEEKKKEMEVFVKERMRDVKLQLSEEEIKAEVETLRKEWTEGKHQLEEVATDRMELLRITVREFVAGYKEGRDHSAEEVQAAIEKQMAAFRSLVLEGEWTAEAVEENKQKNLRALRDALDRVVGLSEEEKGKVENEVQEAMRAFDASVDSAEVLEAQRKVEALIQDMGKRVGSAVEGAMDGVREGEKKP